MQGLGNPVSIRPHEPNFIPKLPILYWQVPKFRDSKDAPYYSYALAPFLWDNSRAHRGDATLFVIKPFNFKGARFTLQPILPGKKQTKGYDA